ncbi:ribosome assembly cofactor RimP [Winogradskyella sp.]|uniref:ribosome assembly cofactor RimP n=1 Tax=Winogradskyella sp. TaxID=1883156 RepID=UPI003BACB7A1
MKIIPLLRALKNQYKSCIFAPLFTIMNKREDEESSLFISDMFRETVKELLDNALNERQDLFLIDFDILSDYTIRVVLDGDKGVLVEDCMFVSRSIEHNLDREAQDFSLEVTSSGAASPLVLPRQYNKHIGRTLEVKTNEGNKLEGQLTEASEDGILLTWKAREPKPVGKGKVTVTKEAAIAFSDIKEAKVKIKF